MFFKQLSAYRIVGNMPNQDVIKAALEKMKYRECKPHEAIQAGWVSPVDDSYNEYVYHIMQSSLVCLKIEEKNIPASVVNEELKKRLEAYKAKNPDIGKISRELKNEMKDDIVNELLPRTLSKISRIHAVIDHKENRVIVNVANAKKSEYLLTLLKGALDHEIEFKLIRTKEPAGPYMAEWILNNDVPGNFSYGDECSLVNTETKNKIRYQNHDLDDEFLRTYVTNDLEVDSMSLHWKDHHSFILTDSLLIKKIKGDDALLNELDIAAESAMEYFNNELQQQIKMWREWLPEIWEVLGGVDE